jgi:hypothetical protein
MNQTRIFLGALLCAVLTACGGGGGGDGDRHENTTIDTAGRLAIAEDSATALRIYDLDSARVESTLALANPPSALYTSPGGRYALVFQRTQDTVQVADGGIWQEDHGDHLHDYREAPRLLPSRISGPQPTHYDDRAGQAAIFMDGREAAGSVSSAVLFTDTHLGTGNVAASVSFGTAMHGFAEPNGDFLIASYRAPGASGPTQAEVYRRSGTQYQFVERLPAQCPAMHGSHTRAGITLAGCADGVLVVAPQGTGTFTATRITTPTGVGTIAGHAAAARAIAFGNAGTPSTTRFYDVDPVARTATPITIAGWTEGRLRRAHGFDRQGRHFFVLDDAGTLHVLEASASGWTSRKTLPGAIPAMPGAAPFPQLATNEGRDEVYLSDPSGRQLVVVNTTTLEVARRLPLDFKPTYLAWMGIKR